MVALCMQLFAGKRAQFVCFVDIIGIVALQFIGKLAGVKLFELFNLFRHQAVQLKRNLTLFGVLDDGLHHGL